uniref:MLO-like protein n=1 Tax=Chenopodium quinoa TaxID=63459 RepID=A0A803L853_CHEQI
MANAEETEEMSLEFTPTWVVAVVCFIIIAISLLVERCIHYGGKLLKKKNQKPLFEALQKLKEELMLLGFISLMLTVLQGAISKMCIPEKYVRNMLPCSLKDKEAPAVVEHLGRLRRLLSEAAVSQSAYCASKHKVPFLSVEGLHHLHIFIFVLAVVHVTFSVLTIRQWKHWEDAIAKENYDTDQALKPAVTHVHDHAFIRDHFVGVGEKSSILRWMHSFIKQFYGAVTKADYLTLRMGFIMTHCRGNRKFNFHKYMIRALEDDFKRVVGIRQVLVSLGICDHLLVAECQRLAYIFLDSIYSVHCAIWFRLLYYGTSAVYCTKAHHGVIIQVLCSYSTLPLYAIVTQMGSNFKKAIFDEHVQAGILGWREKVKKKKGLKGSVNGSTTGETSTDEGSATRIQMARLIQKGKEGNEIQPSST